MAHQQAARLTFRLATCVEGRRLIYPLELQVLPSFSKWLYRHVRNLRDSGFPIPEDIVRLSCLPSKVVASYRTMRAYGAHYRCDDEESITHATYNSGIAVMESGDLEQAINVGILRQIFLVYFGSLTVVVLKVSWIKQTDQGRRAIKRDNLGFWSVLFSAREDSSRKNPFVLPANVTQCFFVDDQRDPNWKVVVLHEPRSRRIIGSRDSVADGADFALETPIPEESDQGNVARGIPQEISLEDVQVIDGALAADVDESVFYDTECEDACVVV